MGFFESLGKAAGRFVAQAEQLQEQANMYRGDYEYMSNNELKEEGRKLQSHSNPEAKARVLAIKIILKERGAM